MNIPYKPIKSDLQFRDIKSLAYCWEFSGTPPWNGMKIGSLLDVHDYASYKHHSRCAVFRWSWRMFYIPRTYAFDVWKIVYGRLKSKVFAKNSHKMIEYSEAWQSFRDLNFKNPLESHFSFNKKCFVGRPVMNQNALHFPDLGKCFTYSKRMLTTHTKFSKGFWSQSFHQKLIQNDRIFWSLAEFQRLEFQQSTRKSLFLQ